MSICDVKTYDVKVVGSIVPVTPLVQMPSGGDRKKKHETWMQTLNIILDDESASYIENNIYRRKVEGENIDSEQMKCRKIYQIPVYTANGIRGMLRRKCAYLVLDAITKRLKKRGEIDKWLEIVNLLRAGGGKDQSVVHNVPPKRIYEYVLKENIHLGLFGGGLCFDGRLFGTDAIPLSVESYFVLKKMGMRVPDESEIFSLPLHYEIRDMRHWVRRKFLLYL